MPIKVEAVSLEKYFTYIDTWLNEE
jgi:hypothetical protein